VVVSRLGCAWILILLGACVDAVDWARKRPATAETLAAAPEEWRTWLQRQRSGSGDGDGYGYGYGDGDGDAAHLDIAEIEHCGERHAGDVRVQMLQLVGRVIDEAR
jgi:hypothetical protein